MSPRRETWVTKPTKVRSKPRSGDTKTWRNTINRFLADLFTATRGLIV
jgi:hypothetical protein